MAKEKSENTSEQADSHERNTSHAQLSRRSFLTNLGASATLGSLLPLQTAAAHATPGPRARLEYYPDPHFTTVRITNSKLSESFDGFRIAFISDIHYGHAISLQWLQTTFERVAQYQPDLLLFGGDYIWIPDSRFSRSFPVQRNEYISLLTPYGKAVNEVFSHLQELSATVKPPHGTYAVSGNHDLWHLPHSALQKNLGKDIHLLRNEGIRIQRGNASIEVFGVEDYWSGFPDLSPQLGSNYRILLSHNPDYAAKYGSLSDDETFDLALCGHTHGGQIRLPFVGALTYNINHSELGTGAWQLSGGQQGITSSGLGVVEVPFRINCPPEVSFVELKSPIA